MDSQILQNFLKNADNYLPMIRSNILICARDGNNHGELHAALHQIRTIANEASEAKLKEIKRTAGKIEKELAPLADSEQPLTEEKSRKLLDSLAILEAYLTKLAFSDEIFALDVGDFVEESFDNLTLKKSSSIIEEEEETEKAEEEEFEIDEEMLEVFALEAEELLQNINTNLERLEDAPNDREALLEIRRSAHTLKGSAGIIGLKKLSALAHRVEDLLDFLAENEIEGNVKIFELLLTATDCFETLANGESSLQLEKKLKRIYKNFDEILTSLQTQKTETPAPVKTSTAAPVAAVQPQEHRSTIRVSSDKLDELVKIVSDLLVSRSVFEQRLIELNRQIEELHNSTNRLQQASGKLEIDFGANQFHTPNSRFPFKNFNFEKTSRMVSEFDSLEFDIYTEFHQTTHELLETTADTTAIGSEMDIIRDNLEMLFDNQRRAIEELQEKLLRLRVVKFGMLSARLQRTVRVTCEEENKLANLIIEGENQEFDTQILDSLVEPLLHLLRNAVAHGIEPPETRRLLGKSETGNIILKIRNEGTHVNLTVSDDGRGISPASLIQKAVENHLITRGKAERMSEDEAFDLMFLPGLTTAEKLSQVSGRGVGMNIVKTNISRQQGTISVKSKPQKGTIFTIRLPMSLAVTRALLVKIGEDVFAFPLKTVKQITEISAEQFAEAVTKNILQIDEKSYFPANLSNLLEISTAANTAENIPILLIEKDESNFAVAVDEILKTEEIIIKPLGFPLQKCGEFLGAAILGDGRVIPVLDLIFLLTNEVQNSKFKVQNSESEGQISEAETLISEFQIQNSESEILSSVSEIINSEPQSLNENLFVPNQSELRTQKSEILNVLVVDDSPSVRHVTAKLIKNAGWNASIAKDGLEALEILQESKELPQIILTDVEMPRMNGYELLAALKQKEDLRRIPVIMITSRSGDKHRQKAIELGVSEYLTKPFEDAFLLEKIKFLTA